ncbi:MAG: HAD-IA family hydrolase [Gammaproteobacteria bacterium]|nr:HAD-IA family hydrolase [Gammaproteobacteria bacterium]
MELSGRVVTGTGQAAGFTELDHAKRQFLDKLGIDTWPGTLNVRLDDADSLSEWRDLRNEDGIGIHAPDGNNCHARSYPVQINNQLTGAIIFPEVNGYPDNQVEVIAPLSLRRHFSLNDGDSLRLNVLTPVRTSAVLFDLDGTLVDTVDAFYQLAKQTGAEFGLEVSRERMYETLNHGISYWDHVVPESMEDRPAMIKKLNNRAMELWPELIKDNAGAFSGVRETLSGLKTAGYALGIVTGSGEWSLDLLFGLGVADMFDAVVTGYDVKKRKPDPEGLNKCLKHMDIAPGDAVYVGDSVIDMQASRAAGVLPIAVLTGAGTSASLCEAGAHRIVRSHEQVRALLAT